MTHDIAGAALALRRRRPNGKPVYQAKKSMCPEIACDKDAVVNRIAGTVRLNILCRNGAKALGMLNRSTWVV
jgi:uncharacterized radical SAM superfamily Fe-S cluster-containing enzyme